MGAGSGEADLPPPNPASGGTADVEGTLSWGASRQGDTGLFLAPPSLCWEGLMGLVAEGLGADRAALLAQSVMVELSAAGSAESGV